MTQVILVDEKDQVIGYEEKMKAHQNGKLHRAFSILVFNEKGEIMLQKRASSKYHCAGLWTNTCCSHPLPGELLEESIHNRLLFEMGFDCTLHKKTSFIYKASFDNGLTEHEYDHVFTGIYSGMPNCNPDEVEDFRWMPLEELKHDINKNFKNYTIWFIHICQKLSLI